MQSEPNTTGPAVSRPAPARLSSVPLFHAAWLFAAGIGIAHAAWLRPSWVLIALAPVAVLCCIAAFRTPRIVWLPVAMLWCLLGAWCAEMEPHPVPAPEVAALSDGLLRTVEGTVIDAAPVRRETVENVEETRVDGPSQRIDLRVSSIEFVNDFIDAQSRVDGGVRLTVRWPLEEGKRARSPSVAAIECAPSSACFRRRFIVIPVPGAARIICSNRASPLPHLSALNALNGLEKDETVPWPAASPGCSTTPAHGCWHCLRSCGTCRNRCNSAMKTRPCWRR